MNRKITFTLIICCISKIGIAQNDEIVTVELKGYTDTALNLGIGMGAFIRDFGVVQLKYNMLLPELL